MLNPENDNAISSESDTSQDAIDRVVAQLQECNEMNNRNTPHFQSINHGHLSMAKFKHNNNIMFDIKQNATRARLLDMRYRLELKKARKIEQHP